MKRLKKYSRTYPIIIELKTNKICWQVIDGTPCNKDSFDKCVNGICRPAGCDNKLYSDAKLNKCGVCQAYDDICEDVFGKFSALQVTRAKRNSKFSDYYHVIRIPKGAANITINQPGSVRSQNYIGEMQ